MSEPKWKEEYRSMGVTSRELYLRQEGLCYLRVEKDEEGEVTIYCTDGNEKAETARMLNPTLECAKCMSRNLVKVIKDGVKVE
jgi:hypothetical protein